MAELRHEDVRRLDVPVQHPDAVSRLDCRGDLHAHREHLGHRNLLRAVAVGERTGTILDHHVRPSIARYRGLVERQDRGVGAERRHDVGLDRERAHGGVTHLRVQHLDRDLAARHVLLEQEDIREAALPERPHMRVAGEHGGLERRACHDRPSPARGRRVGDGAVMTTG